MPPFLRCCVLGFTALTVVYSASFAQAARHIPKLTAKPAPVVVKFGTCQPDGKNGDPAENHLKNRTDTSKAYTTVEFSAFTELTDPTTLKKPRRSDWKAAVLHAIEASEGVPVALEGFLAQVTNADQMKHGARPEGAESTNCGATSPTSVDWHLWILPAAGESRSKAVIAEITPRVRAKHPGWLLSKLDRIAKDGVPVRVAGWSMFDPEHPEQLGATRATLWEIHPITRLEVREGISWISLDSWKPKT